MENKEENGNDYSNSDYKVEILPDEHSQYDLSFKLIVIGDSNVGKTCLTSKATKDDFQEYYQATIGFEFMIFNIRLNKTVIKLQIWDTCGQEVYRSLISNFYRNSSLAIMVYAIDDQKSFLSMESWLEELKNQANPDVKVFLIGNKSDLEDSRQVDKAEAEEFAKEKKIDLFLETSAKTGFNAKNVLIEAAKMLFKDYEKYREESRKNSLKKEQFNYNKKKGQNLGEDGNKKGNDKENKCCK